MSSKINSPLNVFKEVLETPKYIDEIKNAVGEGRRSIIIDYEDVVKVNEITAKKIKETPLDTINAGLNAVRLVMVEEGLVGTSKPLKDIKPYEIKDIIKIPIRHIRYCNVEEIELEEVRAEYVHKLVSIKGIVRNAGEPKVTEYKKTFKCPSCREKEPIEVTVEEGLFKTPNKCSCGKDPEVVEKLTEYEDTLVVKIQEPPETAKSSTPRQLKAVLEGDVARFKIDPGDIITITGIIKVDKTVKGYKPFYIQGINVEVEDNKYEEIDITPEEEEEILELSKDPEIEEKITNTIAPRIQGYREFKEAIGLQLFGGVPSEEPQGHIRGDIHVLVVGDPGIGKSVTLTYISYNLAPRGIYTTGAGSSGVGLTATTTKVDEEWTLDAGPMVLADRGICVIDEFDKMGIEDRNTLHEPLEQQRISIAKAGIMASLNTRCSVLAGANPKGGRILDGKTPKELINLPDPVISRFDLIFLLKDIPDRERDGQIIDLIVNPEAEEEAYKKGIDPELLRKYVAYSRRVVRPKIKDPKVQEAIKKYYVEERQDGKNKEDSNGERDRPIPIGPRMGRGLKRLVEANARLHLREEVIYEDVKKAVRLIEYCQKLVGIDPFTGRPDMDILEGRVGTGQKKFKEIVKLAVLEKKEDMGGYSWYKSVTHIEDVVETIKEECRKVNLVKATEDAIKKEIHMVIEWEVGGTRDVEDL